MQLPYIPNFLQPLFGCQSCEYCSS